MGETMTQSDFCILAWGLIYASVCTRLDDEKAGRRLNLELPTGISSHWEICDEPTFTSGETNPHPCPDAPETHRHILFNC